MVAVPLIFGRLTVRDYENNIASDPRIDALREKITCVEGLSFTADYHNPSKRSIAIEKYKKNLSRIFNSGQQKKIELSTLNRDSLEKMSVPDFMEFFIPDEATSTETLLNPMK